MVLVFWGVGVTEVLVFWGVGVTEVLVFWGVGVTEVLLMKGCPMLPKYFDDKPIKVAP
jgi:hypothetical protein